VHGANGVMKARVKSSRINIGSHPELPDPPQALKHRMFNQVEQKLGTYGNETVHRIIHDFSFVAGSLLHVLAYLCNCEKLLICSVPDTKNRIPALFLYLFRMLQNYGFYFPFRH